ncbi:MAG: penicillin-binding protein activator [Pseudomonadota bacterium]
MALLNTRHIALCLTAAFALSACAGTGGQFGSDFATPGEGTGLQQSIDGLPPANGRIIGKGPVRVALLVPSSAQGFGALAAENFANAADLAIREFGEDTINIVVKDTAGSPQGAASATREALSEGAELILGPVFSNSVPAAAGVARPSGVPILAFSNSNSIASRGVNIFGFTPEPGIERAIRHAGETGSRSFAALLPNNALGTLAEAAFRQSVPRAGGRIVQVARYSYENDDPRVKAQEIGSLVASGQIDTVFIPDAGDIAPQLVTAVKQAIPQGKPVKFVGSGQWDDPRIFRNPALEGSIYAAPDRSGYNAFAQRYNAAFGKPPIRLASLAYDATSLLIVLSQNFPDDKFSLSRLTSRSGFKGTADGTFRISGNGRVERSLAVYEVTATGPQIVSPAATTFAQPTAAVTGN